MNTAGVEGSWRAGAGVHAATTAAAGQGGDGRADGRQGEHADRNVTALLDTHTAEPDRRFVELTALCEEVRLLRGRADHVDPADRNTTVVCHVIPTDG